MCEIRLTKLSCAAQQVGIVHFYAVTEIKGLSCRLWWMCEWRNLLTSTHVGYRSVIRAVASGASLKFGVQGASATNWFSRVNGARDNGIRLYQHPVGRGRKISATHTHPSTTAQCDPSNQSLLKLLRHVFLGNIITFSDGDKLHYYLQTNGVSLGSKCAPSAACVFMGDFERQHLTNLPNDQLKPFIWLRYIEDIFAIWPHGNDSLTVQSLAQLSTSKNTIRPSKKEFQLSLNSQPILSQFSPIWWKL